MNAVVRGSLALLQFVCMAVIVGCSGSGGSKGGGQTCPAGSVAVGTSCSSIVGSGGQPAFTTGSGGAPIAGGTGGVVGAGTGGAISVAGAGGASVAGGTGAAAGAGTGGMDATGTGGMGTAGMMAQQGSGGGAASGSGGSSAPAMPTSGCGAADHPASGMQMLDVDGTQRTFIVQIPDNYDANTPYKLVFAWHGLGGTADQIARSGYYGLQQRANNSTIFVAAQGLETSSSVGSGPGWDNMGGRDVAFTSAMLDYMRSSYCIDDQRIFSVGMSYGGIMSNTVGCALGDQFRAIAPMSGSGPLTFGGTTCTGQVAAWLSHGNQDNVVPFTSGQASRDHWAQANHCDSTTQPEGSNGCVAYQGCDDGYPVVWCEFDGGHMVPTFASAEIWTFLSQF